MNQDDVQAMVQLLRQGIVAGRPAVVLEGEADCDEVYVVSGRMGNAEAVNNKATPGDAGGYKVREGGAPWPRRGRRSLA